MTARPVGDGDGQDGLRSALHDLFHGVWHVDQPTNMARSVLAVPEVAALRAKAAAADRVRSLIAEHQAAHVNTVWLDRLRRALDGDVPC